MYPLNLILRPLQNPETLTWTVIPQTEVSYIMSSARTFLQIDSSIDVSHSNNPASLAYSTARTRWPKIIVAAIADVETSLSKLVQNTAEFNDGKVVVNHLKNVLSDLKNSARMMPLLEDGSSAIKDFNDELRSLSPMSWHNSPWLFTENYMYRLINTCFSMRRTTFWKTYDVFAIQKAGALKSSKAVITEVVQWYVQIDEKIHESTVGGADNFKDLMEEMIQSFKKNVVDDDTEQVWGLLSSIRKGGPNREIHIVLDNAGFEFLTDLILVAYLLVADYATKIVLHGKDIPWFVSDVTAGDVEATLNTLKNTDFSSQASELEAYHLKKCASELCGFFDEGRLCYEADPFWTTQHPYARMPELAPKLYSQLAAAELVIFKGDLNYRKLVFDGLWPHTTTFQHALGLLGTKTEPGRPGLRILALRTCKADTCMGLAPGRAEKIDP